ncbi:hypothetical protein PM082_020605 [Marasmius tenuissimus]|nr:hypothetical protein PM082_020605 [Marasmius tenuissimus]
MSDTETASVTFFSTNSSYFDDSTTSTEICLDSSTEIPSMLNWGVSATSRLIDESGRARRGRSDPPASEVRFTDSELPQRSDLMETNHRRRPSQAYSPRPRRPHDCRTARRHSTYRERELTRDFFLIIGFCFVLAFLLLCLGRGFAHAVEV